MSNKKSIDGISIIELAVKGLNPIKELVETDNPLNKLLALNIILVFVVLGLSISHFIGVTFNDLASIVIIVVSFIFAAIITGAYAFIVNLLIKSYKIKAVRMSIFVLFITVPISVIGFIYNLRNLINFSLLLIFIQVLILIVIPLFFKEEKIAQESNLWNILGKINTILGLISSIITIGGLIFRFVI